MDDDTREVYETSIKMLNIVLDNFIDACMSEDGTPKAPTKQELMRARGFLPSWCPHTLTVKKKR